MLAHAFADVPAFDEAVDGDLVALIGCVQIAMGSMWAVLGIAFGAVFVWGLASWFLGAGIYGVFAQRPEGRRDTARCFGAAGASLYLPYVRIALCSAAELGK